MRLNTKIMITSIITIYTMIALHITKQFEMIISFIFVFTPIMSWLCYILIDAQKQLGEDIIRMNELRNRK